MQKNLRKKAEVYKLKIMNKGTTWFHVGSDYKRPDYLKINTLTESFKVDEEYTLLAVKEESYSAKWGRKTYYHPVTEEEAAELEINLDIENARKKLERCKNKNSISSTVKKSIIKLAHSNEDVLKELNDFEEDLKKVNISLLENAEPYINKDYSIKNTPYIADKYKNKCIEGDLVLIIKKNNIVVWGKISSFNDGFFIVNTKFNKEVIYLEEIVEIQKK